MTDGGEGVSVYWAAESENAQVPTKAHPTDAGWDLYVSQFALIGPGEHQDIHTGICLGLPEGYYGHIMARSSTMRRYRLLVMEAVIDQGYRGELFFQVLNVSAHHVRVEQGLRLAQLLILPVPSVIFQRVNVLPQSARGSKGFGDSGR